MVDIIRRHLEGKKILLLGFGREGESSYHTIRKWWPRQKIWIADRNSGIGNNESLPEDPNIELHCGEDYLEAMNHVDLVLKSPGISLKGITDIKNISKVTSQTDLFLLAFAPQVTGITGTKGKSTTSSLIYHILNTCGKEAILLGNIGTPAWHFLNRIRPDTVIVDELSSHQLEYIHRGPHIAVLLNIFEEHLDAYASYHDYQVAKMKISTTQASVDFLIYNADDPVVEKQLLAITSCPSPSDMLDSDPERIRAETKQRESGPFMVPMSMHQEFKTGAFLQDGSIIVHIPEREELAIREVHNRYLKGDHNLRNTMAAITACWFYGVEKDGILDGLASYKGLAHRMEYLGFHHGIHWVNDSIATIPEACIAALKALPDVDTLILGGFDRGISYGTLAHFLITSSVRTLIFVGAAGRRIGTETEKADQTIKSSKRLFYINRFDHFLPLALEHTRPGAMCLLSPAASSYDEFRSFEERGFRFRELVQGVGR